MQQALEFNLDDRGGFHRLESYSAAKGWVIDEMNRWSWLKTHPRDDRFGIGGYVEQRFNTLLGQLQTAELTAQPLNEQGPSFRSTFRIGGEVVLHSGGTLGRTVIEIYESEGAHAAFAAYAFITGRINLSQLSGVRELLGVMLLANPAGMPAANVAENLRRERRNLRERADRLIERLENEASARNAEHRHDRRRGRQIAARWARTFARRWEKALDQRFETAGEAEAEFATSRQQTADEFATLRATYEETMRLQAPAAYWRSKAEKHKISQRRARDHLLVFFPIALIALVSMFGATGYLILKHPPEANATAVYVVISGGLATLAAVCFWIGRLLTKLYLSEHHLRIDAEEREVMTTTYLALTKDKAAADADRQIILGALFRNAPDGIVKDDGPADLNLAMLLSRLGVPAK